MCSTMGEGRIGVVAVQGNIIPYSTCGVIEMFLVSIFKRGAVESASQNDQPPCSTANPPG